MAAPRRIQRQRTKGWRMPEGAVYVGRPGRWGNPFPVDAEPFTRADSVRLYRDLIVNREAWFTDLAGTRYETRCRFTRWHGKYPVPTVEEIRRDLAGKDLACWCPVGLACHADVLLELANGPTR